MRVETRTLDSELDLLAMALGAGGKLDSGRCVDRARIEINRLLHVLKTISSLVDGCSCYEGEDEWSMNAELVLTGIVDLVEKEA